MQDLKTERLKELEEKVKKLKWKLEGNTRHINMQKEAHRKAMSGKEELIAQLLMQNESAKVAALIAQCARLSQENEELLAEKQDIAENLLWQQRQMRDRTALAEKNENLVKKNCGVEGVYYEVGEGQGPS